MIDYFVYVDVLVMGVKCVNFVCVMLLFDIKFVFD